MAIPCHRWFWQVSFHFFIDAKVLVKNKNKMMKFAVCPKYLIKHRKTSNSDIAVCKYLHTNFQFKSAFIKHYSLHHKLKWNNNRNITSTGYRIEMHCAAYFLLLPQITFKLGKNSMIDYSNIPIIMDEFGMNESYNENLLQAQFMLRSVCFFIENTP